MWYTIMNQGTDFIQISQNFMLDPDAGQDWRQKEKEDRRGGGG